ncbi:MAG TPA: universal stress protein [Thermoplasmata archaeon]|nr:universal stress protein [Thermoplasmata archaeon]
MSRVYRKILLPVATPSEVEPMIRFAARLLDSDGEIRVLHLIPSSTLTAVTREWRASVNLVVPAHEAAAALELNVEPEVRTATEIPTAILESAEEREADAILLTLRGDKRSRNPLVGHTVTGILQHARTDVLVVNRLALTGDKFPRILVTTFRPEPARRTLQLAEVLSVRSGGAPVVLLALGPRGPGEGISVREDRSERGIPFTRKRSIFSEALLGRRRRLPELILQAAAKERFGLLVVGEEDDRAGGPLLTRRFLEELFRAAPCPVIALRT